MSKKIFLWGQNMSDDAKVKLEEFDKEHYPYSYGNTFGELKRLFKDKFPDVNDDTIILSESEINGEKRLFQHTSSDFFFFVNFNFEYDKEHNALIERINK